MRFSLLGDSNVKRHLSPLNCRNQPAMSSAELKVCGRFEIFAETLRSIRSDSTGVILSCITNFLTSSDTDGESSSAAVRVEPLLLDLRETLLSFCQEQPDRSFFLAPPMYRTSPLWYLDGLPEVLLKFSEVFRAEKPPNLFLLPSFQPTELEADGVHLTPYAGFRFVVHLFDAASEALLKSKQLPAVAVVVQQESIRCLEDRVSVLEQDHKRLNRSVEYKSVINSESLDYAENQRFVFSVTMF